MEYLIDWSDISKVSQIGWSGNRTFDGDALVLTATNGWRSFGWELDEIVGKTIIFEFDYIYTDLSNQSGETPFVVNEDTVTYGSTKHHTIPYSIDAWRHCWCRIATAKKFIGINVRGVDSTGKNLTMKIRNVRVHSDNGDTLEILPTGELKASMFQESYINDATFEHDTYISKEFYEF